MKTCVAYCRVSTDHTDQKNSLEAQKAFYTNLFASNNYNPAKVGMLYKKDGTVEQLNSIFADEGISGTSLKRREAFNTMIEYAKKGAFNVIYVKSVSRFTRSVEDGAKVLKDLKEVGVSVIFEDCGQDSLDSNSEFEINLRMMLAQEESRNKSDNVRWGLKRLYERGGWNGGAPYGYDTINAQLVINTEEANNVKKIFELYIDEGYGIGKIARYLNTNGIPTKAGSKWSQTQVTRILQNEIYNGVQKNHTIETIDINRKIKQKINKEKQIVNFNEALRIIDKDTFDNVQRERLKRNEMFSRHTHHSNTYLLSTLIYCGHCGGNFKRKKRHSYRLIDGESIDIGYEWTCSINDMYGKSRCGHRNMLIEDDIIADIKSHIEQLKTDDMRGYFELYLLIKFNHDTSVEKLEELRVGKETIKKQIRKFADDFSKGMMDENLYDEMVKDLYKEISEIDSAITRIEQHDLEVENAKVKYQEYLKYIKEVDINNLTNTIVKRLFRKIIVKGITLADGTKSKMISYEYNFMGMTLEELLAKAEKIGVIKVNKITHEKF